MEDKQKDGDAVVNGHDRGRVDNQDRGRSLSKKDRDVSPTKNGSYSCGASPREKASRSPSRPAPKKDSRTSSGTPASKDRNHKSRSKSSSSRSNSPTKERRSASPSKKRPETPVAPPFDTDGPRQRGRSPDKTSTTKTVDLYHHFPDMTEEACKTFSVIPDCLYGSKNMGAHDNDALDCDCIEQWYDGTNHSCGDESDCINRLTKMECVSGVGSCGDGCQNQRFQKKQYANVSVIKTQQKGHGLRADSSLQSHQFIFEYIGEVINEATFRRRMVQYDKEGIKHFYFMSLTKNEFVDATRKGNLGRFCNHSCNPNCYVDKWVVGDKLRMGIFALRTINRGEELVFNYNVDRYGADPQPCYCGEVGCVGYIGGKTQTGRGTKLSPSTIEALGIDDGDSWDTAAAKKPRRKKPNEDDEEYVNRVEARILDEDGARKVMAQLRQCKEKWIAVKLLQRIQRCQDSATITWVMRMHGYQIIKTVLNTFFDDNNVVLQCLSILDRFPRVTRNKIVASNIEETVKKLADREDHEEVAAESKRLLNEWSQLEEGYRIARRGPNSRVVPNTFEEERRKMGREEPKKEDNGLGDDVPKGPRSNIPQRAANFMPGQRQFRRKPPPPSPLPEGWFESSDRYGFTFFYNDTGESIRVRPTKPAPKLADKAKAHGQLLQSIIAKVERDKKKEMSTPKSAATRTPQQAEIPEKETKSKEKWRALPLEKQMKIYENTINPNIKHVVNKYTNKMSRDALKRYFKEVSKLIVTTEFDLKRVDDPTNISRDDSVKIKSKVKKYLDKAVAKEQRAAQKTSHKRSTNNGATDSAAKEDQPMPDAVADEDVVLSDIETGSSSSQERKRKRTDDDDNDDNVASPIRDRSETPSAKRFKDDEGEPAPPPPPPPPPLGEEEEAMVAEQMALREQEEALMRENEEAERLDAVERDFDNGNMTVEEEEKAVNGHDVNGGVMESAGGDEAR